MPSFSTRRRPGLRLARLAVREVPALVTATDDIDDFDPAVPGDWAGPNHLLSLPEAIRQVNAGADTAIYFDVDTVTLTQPLPPITVPVSLFGKPTIGPPGTAIDGAGVNAGL